ncbi:DUF3617 domain-containing protein [Qipengyuania sp.]|uniref:DUF3617 domain-containing protein n=1 Tax=Qipengyuania sp. TaxID=2004515 RepID=UPI0035C86251
MSLTLATAILAGCGDSNGADTNDDGEITSEEMAKEAVSGGDITMRAGRWEHRVQFTEMDIPGVPDDMRDMMRSRMENAITSEQCLTEEEASRPSPEFFGSEDQKDCRYDEFDRSGNRMTLRMTCQAGEGGTVNVAMDGDFGEESFSLDFDNEVTGNPMGRIIIKGSVSGKRIGDC